MADNAADNTVDNTIDNTIDNGMQATGYGQGVRKL
jgi:hypothetical protein